MNRQEKSLLATVVLLLVVHHSTAINHLFSNRQSDYTITLPANASPSEKTAAKELQFYIQKIANTTLPIVTAPATTDGKHIYIGWNAETGEQKPDDDDETYTYKTVGSNLHIYGGSQRGTMYGVFSFLERELGVHWFTSSFTAIPSLKQYQLKTLNHSESPIFKHRLDLYYDAIRHYDWQAHNLLNSQYILSKKTTYGPASSYWGIHTFRQLLPPEKYFKTHPEYYSLYKGMRSDDSQLCLSNEDMHKELVKNLKMVIAQQPDYWCYDVSQNDNQRPCECTSCQQLVRKYGGQSGIMLWFVNQVAEEIRKTYPEKHIGTFAYQYTRQAPQSNIRPAKNVVIRLCDIECCMAHPLDKCEKNLSFVSDLNAWKAITEDIYIWDYTTGFHNYLLPFPNINTLSKNYQLFHHSNVIGILEEGAHDAPWNEFSELKQWLIAKLLWNPYQNTDSLVNIFIKGYYGSASPHVIRYYRLCQSQVTHNSHFTVTIDWNSPIYNNRFMTEGDRLMEKAIRATKREEREQMHVKRLAAQLHYLKVRRHSVSSVADGNLKTLVDIIQNDSTIIHENKYTVHHLLRDLTYH